MQRMKRINVTMDKEVLESLDRFLESSNVFRSFNRSQFITYAVMTYIDNVQKSSIDNTQSV